jgi:hypothetical protein
MNFCLMLEEEVIQQENQVKLKSIFIIFASQIITIMNLDCLFLHSSRMNFIPCLNLILFLKYSNVLFDSWIWVSYVVYLNQRQVPFIQLLVENFQSVRIQYLIKFIQWLLLFKYPYFNSLFLQNSQVDWNLHSHLSHLNVSWKLNHYFY